MKTIEFTVEEVEVIKRLLDISNVRRDFIDSAKAEQYKTIKTYPFGLSKEVFNSLVEKLK